MQSNGGEQDMQQVKTTFNAYAIGVYYASACTSLTDDEAVECMRTEYPPGAWKIADEGFATGQANGRQCDQHPRTRRHVLFTR